jgi:hypothetical protein
MLFPASLTDVSHPHYKEAITRVLETVKAADQLRMVVINPDDLLLRPLTCSGGKERSAHSFDFRVSKGVLSTCQSALHVSMSESSGRSVEVLRCTQWDDLDCDSDFRHKNNLAELQKHERNIPASRVFPNFMFHPNVPGMNAN